MDTSTLIVSLVLIVLIMAPIIFLATKSSHNKKAKYNLMNSFFAGERLILSEYEAWGSHSIGIDSESGKVVFITFGREDNKIESFDLHKVKKCEVSQVTRRVDSNTQVTDMVGLKFLFKEPPTATQALEFFNNEMRVQLTNEAEIAKKWADLINNSISKINQ
jgi:hypothetical protein